MEEAFFQNLSEKARYEHLFETFSLHCVAPTNKTDISFFLAHSSELSERFACFKVKY